MRIFFRDWPFMLLIIALLVVQAQTELAMPKYTSGIVNVGIQQSGIGRAVPDEIRAAEYQKLLFLISDDSDKALVEAHYSLSEDGSRMILDGVKDTGTLDKIESAFKIPMVIAFAGQNITADSALMENFSALMPSAPAGTDTGAGAGDMPDFTNPAVINAVRTQLEQLEGSITQQIALSYVRGEYEQIGLDIDKLRTDYMLHTGGVMLIYAFAALLASGLVTLLSARVGARFARKTRSKVFSTVLSFSAAEMDSFSTASLITRSTNDIQQVQMVLIMMLRMIIYAPILGAGAMYSVWRDQSTMSWIIVVAVAALLALVLCLFIFALPKFQVLQKLVDRVNLVAREILTGLPVIRAFSQEEHEKKRFDAANLDLTKVNIFVNRAMAIMMPTMMFIMNGVSVLIIWVGAGHVDSGTMQVGDLMAFIAYTMQIIMAFLMLSMMSIMLPRAIVAMKRLGEVLGKKVTITDPENPVGFDRNLHGTVEFDDVSFRYTGAAEDVLKHISFKSLPGQTTAIIGSTGSGKSTLANLLPRFFDVTDGSIRVNGVDIRKVTMRDLREKIGYVPQKAVLFSGTVAGNIAYSNPDPNIITDADIRAAAEIAQATHFISEMTDGFSGEISEAGINISGGQKQRLSIARAIAKKPEIYIFDDSFSALDFKTDVALRQALSKVTKDSTVLIITQRISTVMGADQIIVLDEGEIAGVGTHKTLLQSSEVYRDIAYSQLSAEELADKEDA